MNEILPYINTGLLTLMSIGAGFVSKKLGHIDRTLLDLHNRVAVLETDFKGHEKWCGKDSSRNDREHGEIRESVETTRKSVHGLRNEAFKMMLRDRIKSTPNDE